ncbi:MAG: hypothetical protein AB8G17_13245 [Gammaproteobacteria bacterium]
MALTGSANSNDQRKLIAVNNLREYFRDSLDDALRSQNIEAGAHTSHYVVNMLTLFSRSERFYETTDDGVAIKPLALMLDDALASKTDAERDQRFQRLGDVALFVAGFFARSFARKPIDVDYYIAMGGNAYGTLSNSMRSSSRPVVFCDIFDELARKFLPFVDALNEIADSGYQNSDKDILRLYDVWLRTGSPRAATKLRELGVIPIPSARQDRLQ